MRKSFIAVILTGLILAACQAAPAATSTEAMMHDTATEAMMEEMPSATEAMMEATSAPTDAMMEETSMATDSMMESPTDDMMGDHSMGTEVMSATGSAMENGTMVETPAFFSTNFTDVTSGETFSIDSLQGKVVVVEDMAQWCPTCLSQQKQIKTFLEQMGMPADLVVISLDIDPNEDAATLKDYVATNGFGWHYAVAGVDVTREISDKFGTEFLNPPSTPMFIVDRHGGVQLLPFGVKSADDLVNAVQPLLDAGM